MPKVTAYSGTQLKRDFMEIASPKEYMEWKSKYPELYGEFYDDDMKRKLQEILFMGPDDPFDTRDCHKELWKKGYLESHE